VAALQAVACAQKLAAMRVSSKICAMKICTPEGRRSINPDDVLCVYCGGGDGR
jgi:hypothetical protein